MLYTCNEVLCRHLEMVFGIINDSENFHQSIVRWKKVEFETKSGKECIKILIVNTYR